MKLIKWLIIGLGTLFLLWICGALVKIVGVLLAIVGAVLTGLSSALFSKAFWMVALTALVIYLLVRNRSGASPRRKKREQSDDPFQKVSNLDRRLDRLNDILSRHQ